MLYFKPLPQPSSKFKGDDGAVSAHLMPSKAASSGVDGTLTWAATFPESIAICDCNPDTYIPEPEHVVSVDAEVLHFGLQKTRKHNNKIQYGFGLFKLNT